MASKALLYLVITIIALTINGCSYNTFINYTPEIVPQNSSKIYKISMKPNLQNTSIEKQSFEASVVIEGFEHKMEKSFLDNTVFEYNYKMLSNKSEAKYFFKVKYQVDIMGNVTNKERLSEFYNIQLTNRYIIAMESSRGLVGTMVPIVGRGFTRNDIVEVGGVIAKTHYVSPNNLVFLVPILPANYIYPVTLKSIGERRKISDFLVDISNFNVKPSEIQIQSKEKGIITVSAEHAAPRGGIYIQISKDSPCNILIPKEVTIPSGSCSINIPFQGESIGSGTLYLNATGFCEQKISFTIIDK